MPAIDVTDVTFQSEVIDRSMQTPVIVDLWAEWCGPCRMLAPTIDKIATDYAGKVKVGKLDTDANRDTAMKYQINAIPTVLVFKGGELKQRIVGLKQERDFKAVLDTL